MVGQIITSEDVKAGQLFLVTEGAHGKSRVEFKSSKKDSAHVLLFANFDKLKANMFYYKLLSYDRHFVVEEEGGN